MPHQTGSVFPKPSIVRRRKVILCGRFGQGNVGDEAFLHAQYSLIASEFDVVVAVEEVQSQPGFQTWWPYSECEIWPYDEVLRSCRNFDVLGLHVGGGSLSFDFAASVLKTAVGAGKHALMTGIDADYYLPDWRRHGATSVWRHTIRSVQADARRQLLQSLDLLSVRFERDRDRFMSQGIAVYPGADWSLGTPSSNSPRTDLDVVVTIRGSAEVTGNHLDAYRQLISSFEQAGRRVSCLPFAPSDRHLFDQMGIPHDAQEIHWHDPRTVLSIVERSRLVISLGRLHPLMFSLRTGRPCLAIDPDLPRDGSLVRTTRVRQFCRDFGVPWYGSVAAFLAAEPRPDYLGQTALSFPERYRRQYDGMAAMVLEALTAPSGIRCGTAINLGPQPAGSSRVGMAERANTADDAHVALPPHPLMRQKETVTLPIPQRKVFHLHVPKCGGTAVNAWLDTSVHAERARPPTFMFKRHGTQWAGPSFLDQVDEEEMERRQAALRRGARDSIQWFDVIHGHVDITPWLEADAYVFTILRDPVARTLSQFRDFRRLAPQDYSHKPPEATVVHEACRTLPFHEVLAQYGHSRFFQFVFEDTQCRTMTQSSIPFATFRNMSPEERAAAAWAKIEQQCARVGLQDRIEELLNRVAFDLGWAPVQRLAMRNVTEKNNRSESDEDHVAAESVTKGDQILVTRAAEHIRQRAAHDLPYGNTEFERDVVATRVRVLSPIQIGTERVFDMNMPVIGWGFSGRDAPNTADTCSWVGPDGQAALYLPVPGPDVRGAVRLYIKGWIHEDLRQETVFLIDGDLVRPVFEERPGMREVLRFPVMTRGSWMKIEIKGRRTMTDAEAGRPSGDPRRKLLNLSRYSYEPV